LLPSGQWTRLNDTPLELLTYTDTSALNGNTYQYRIAAVDTESFESQPTNTLNATPIEFPFDWGFLVVDETRDGAGTTLNPTDQMVDVFYNFCFENFAHANWDVASQGTPSLNNLSHYPLVFWHSDDYTEFLIDDVINTLGSYVVSGGKLVVSGWKYPSALPQSFFDAWFGGVVPTLINSPVLVSAQSQNEMYPDLYPDPDKLTSIWNGMLSMSYVFPGATNVLYTAEISDGGTGNGEPIAIRTDNNGTLILFGIPLYYMMQMQVYLGLGNLLVELYPELANDDDSVIPVPLAMQCYPNPFSENLTIRLNEKTATPVKISVYNLKGQKVKEWISAGRNDITWDGKDNNENPVSSGVYAISINSTKHILTKRVTFIRN
jgi:hypothetical protein